MKVVCGNGKIAVDRRHLYAVAYHQNAMNGRCTRIFQYPDAHDLSNAKKMRSYLNGMPLLGECGRIGANLRPLYAADRLSVMNGRYMKIFQYPGDHHL